MREPKLLKRGGIGVIPTDTIYGIVASAFDQTAVGRVYALKKRTPTKPCIILISSIDDLALFSIELSSEQRAALVRYWPGPTSIIVPCGSDVPEYLQRGTGTLSFRLPNDLVLFDFLRESGPLIAPSANPEGFPPATTVLEARDYFNDSVDFYHDGGTRAGKPSTLIVLSPSGTATILRG